MKVYLNGRFQSQRTTGVQRLATEIVRALDRLLAEQAVMGISQWEVLFPPGVNPDASIPRLRIGARQVGWGRGHVWEQISLPWAARDGLLVSLGNTAPLAHPRQIVMIHDASVFRHGEAYTAAFRAWYRFLLPRIGRRAATVFTNSEFSRSELVRFLGVPAERFEILPLAPDHMLETPADDSVLVRLGIEPQSYVLAPNSESPHKNLAVLANAMQRLDSARAELVLVGWHNDAILRRTDVRWPARTRRAGYVRDGELRALYEHALCFVFPSLYEGFGLSPLEAMACGCPVIMARAAALPEVGGDAALYFDPRSPDDLARRLGRVIENSALRADLSRRGQERASAFSWSASARRLAAAIQALMTPTPRGIAPGSAEGVL